MAKLANARLAGKVAAITGGAGGIGGAVARLFAAEGAAVAVLDLDEAGARAVAAELTAGGAKAMGAALDVADEAAVERAFRSAAEALGPVDILVNTAAIAGAGTVEEMAVADWDRMIRINLRGPFLCARAVLPAMREKQWGRIINFSSEVALRGNAGLSHYAASKAGVIAFGKCLAHEAIADNITVNTLAPGPTDTAMLAGLDPAVIETLIDELMPIGRLGLPDEIAAAALFLAGDDGAFCVGATLNVNGGALMQ
jgi:3-oxoacyl-[acyl-carrier protein] reductase